MIGSEATPDCRVAVLLLAAGRARRFGAPKQLARLAGVPLVQRAAHTALPVAAAGLWVVTGSGHDEVSAILRNEPLTIVHNPEWREGMAASIRAGIRALKGQADAVLIMLADQPAITQADLQRLLAAWQKQPARPAAACVQGRPGVPAVFPAARFSDLLALSGDAGARSLLRDGQDCRCVDMPSAAIDIDTPEALERFVRDTGLSGGEGSA